MSVQKNLEQLTASSRHAIDNYKRFTYSLNSKVPEKAAKNYLENYVNISVKHYPHKLDPKDYKAAPTYSNNVLLSMAFTKAEKLYSELRKEVKEKNAENTIAQNLDSTEAAGEATGDSLSVIELLVLSHTLYTKKNKSLKKTISKNDIKLLKEFQETEEAIYKSLKELRNFHAHIIHQPGPVSFTDAYIDETRTGNKPSQAEWELVKKWLEERFNYALEVCRERLKRERDENELSEEEADQIEKVESRLKKLLFTKHTGELSDDARLFLACMFLRKSDAHFFIKKWTGAKKSDGYFKELHGFYSFYSVRDKKSLKIYDQNLLQYRKILGLLSSVAVTDSEAMMPVYRVINENNDVLRKEIYSFRRNEAKALSGLENTRLSYKEKKERRETITAECKAKISHLQQKIVPLRKDACHTRIYLQYLWDMGLLEGFSVALQKPNEERRRQLEQFGYEDVPLEQFKIKMKTCSEPQQKTSMRAAYKTLKKNFYFYTVPAKPGITEPYFCIKKRNAFFNIEAEIEGKKEMVTLSVSPDFLLKWVFLSVHIALKAPLVKELLQEYVQNYLCQMAAGNFDNMPHIQKNKQFPFSLRVNPADLTKKIKEISSAAYIQQHIAQKIKDLEHFKNVNDLKPAPWKFASKRKIDTVLEYNHIKFLFLKYSESPDACAKELIDEIRHQGLNEMEYMDVYDMLRAFRTEKPNLLQYIKTNKLDYFTALWTVLESSRRIEDIFTETVQRFLGFLKSIKVNEANKKLYSRLFKIHIPPETNEEARKVFRRSIGIPAELLNITTYLNENERNILRAKHAGKKWVCRSDFQYIRSLLMRLNPYTNSDFIFKQVLPHVLKQKITKKLEGPAIKTTLINQLNKIKTEELILWEIAKWYRNAAINTGEFTDISAPLRSTLSKAELNHINSPVFDQAYTLQNPFYTLNNANIEKAVNVTDSTGKNRRYMIEIKAHKFDDEYLYYENAYQKDYLLQVNWPLGKRINYEDINKEIKNEIANSLTDVYLLLCAESHLAKTGYDSQWAPYLKEKFDTKKWDGCYVKFGFENGNDSGSVNNNEIGKKLYDQLLTGYPALMREITWPDFLKYRNRALHHNYIAPKLKNALRHALLQFGIDNKFFEKDERKKN
ncbi:MAG: hypothetical protein WAT19_13590 [Ferruginibacter sp.]